MEQIAVSSPAVRISERTAEQIVDISPGDDRGQRSSSSAGPADEDFPGVFRTFPHGKKVRSAGRSVRTCPGTSAHPRRWLSPSRGGRHSLLLSGPSWRRPGRM